MCVLSSLKVLLCLNKAFKILFFFFVFLLYFISIIIYSIYNYLLIFSNLSLLANLHVIPTLINNPLPFDGGAVSTRLFD